MADDPNTRGGERPSRRTADFANKPLPDVPPSKPLQWFLLAAFLVTGAAYLAGEWAQKASHARSVQAGNLRRMVRAQNDYLSHIKAGDEALANKHPDQAVAEYRLALQTTNTAAGRHALGQALLKQNNPAEAFIEFAEALKLEPELAAAANDWGLALAAQGNLEESARVLRAALEHNPHSGLLNCDLAGALVQMRAAAEVRRRTAENAGKTQDATTAATEAEGFSSQALEHFNAAIQDKFDSPVFWSAYGQLLNELGRGAEAEAPLLRSVSEDANAGAAQFQLALAEDHLGKYAEAIDHYEKVLALAPNDPAALNNLALLYATATNTEVRTAKMAVQLATRACDATSGQNARYMDTLARSYAAGGDFFQAITWEDKATQRAMQLNDQAQVREFQQRQSLLMDHRTGE
ncbi:MAG TPA: tetratricopeptide repeat protein [Verrucomicrobiae bacterium]|jgi:tetratricopeptide (TPR) repeat protein